MSDKKIDTEIFYCPYCNEYCRPINGAYRWVHLCNVKNKTIVFERAEPSVTFDHDLDEAVAETPGPEVEIDKDVVPR